MNRRTRHLVVLLVAVVTASIASFVVYRTVLQMPTHEVKSATQPVVVAARSLALGTSLTEKDVKVIPWPSANPVQGAIGSVEEVLNRGLITTVAPNVPITSDKLAPADTGAGLPPAIPPGMRAISVKVNDATGVAGFVVPGSRVDLVATIRRKDDVMASTVASNVQVLTAGTRLEQQKPETDAKANATTVVTLVVTPEDAERIALAQIEGQITLVLRNPLDQQPTLSPGVRTAALLGQAEPTPAPVVKVAAPRRAAVAPPPVVAPPPPPPAPRMVEAFRGGKRTQEEIKESNEIKEPIKEVIK